MFDLSRRQFLRSAAYSGTAELLAAGALGDPCPGR